MELCPFAKIPYEKGLIRLSISDKKTEEELIDFFINELENLNNKSEKELSTTLIVFPYAHTSFYDFYDFSGELEDLISDAGLSDFVQLVCFHPGFHFEGLANEDRANLVNRAPYPVIQLIRRAEMLRALKDPKEGERISFNNTKKLSSLADSDLRELFHYLEF